MKLSIARLLLARALVAAFIGAGFGLAHAQSAAKVTHVTGTLVETDAAGRSRVLATDSSVSQGARLRTAADSYAHLKFTDGSDIYLRANTEYSIDKYQFALEKPEGDGFAARLLKGGFRQLTGLIGGRNPDSVRINSGTSTIGIRGTDFAVRMCEDKCVADSAALDQRVASNSPVARVVTLQGTVYAHEASTARERQLGSGAALYKGDVVATAEGSQVALYFLDGTRITLAENSVLGVENYAFDVADPAIGRATLMLELGGARILTGAISKANPDNFVLRTPTASISPRGTWLDVLVSAAQDTAQAVADAAAKAAQALADAAAQAAQAAQDAAQAAAKAAQDAAQAAAKAAQDAAQAAAKAAQDAAQAAAKAAQDAAQAAAQAVRGTAQKVGKAVQAAAQKVGKAIQAGGRAAGDLGRAVGGAVRQTGQAAAGAARQAGEAVASALDGADGGTAVDTSITQVSVLDGAAIVTTSQDSQRIDPTTPGLRVAGDGRLVPATGRTIVNALDPSLFQADPVRLFGDAGAAKDNAGVYVLVHDGAVSLAQAGVEIVLVKGETGFASADSKPPQLLDSPPPVLRRDRLLGDAGLFSQICRP